MLRASCHFPKWRGFFLSIALLLRLWTYWGALPSVLPGGGCSVRLPERSGWPWTFRVVFWWSLRGRWVDMTLGCCRMAFVVYGEQYSETPWNLLDDIPSIDSYWRDLWGSWREFSCCSSTPSWEFCRGRGLFCSLIFLTSPRLLSRWLWRV